MMSSALSDAMLRQFFADQTLWLSVHGADPGNDGTSELPYRRQRAAFSMQGGSAVNSDRIEFQNLGDVDITHVGIWDAQDGGMFMQGGEIKSRNRAHVQANAGDTLVLAPGEVVVKRLE